VSRPVCGLDESSVEGAEKRSATVAGVLGGRSSLTGSSWGNISVTGGAPVFAFDRAGIMIGSSAAIRDFRSRARGLIGSLGASTTFLTAAFSSAMVDGLVNFLGEATGSVLTLSVNSISTVSCKEDIAHTLSQSFPL